MKPQAHEQTSSRAGMTLIELLVVIAIIVILMGLVVGIAGSSQRGAAEAKTKAQIGQLVLELEKFRGDKGFYPPNLGADFWPWYEQRYPNTLFDMTDVTGTGNSRVMVDPWGRPYRYEPPTQESPFIFLLGSNGPNGTWNNGTIDDITNRNLN